VASDEAAVSAQHRADVAENRLLNAQATLDALLARTTDRRQRDDLLEVYADVIGGEDDVRYKLPESLGGGEYDCIFDSDLCEDGRSVAFDLPDLDRIVLLPSWILTPVKPPLPEEPPVGAYRIGGVLCMRVSSEPAKCWVYQTKDELFSEETFADLCSDFGTDVVRLVPDPFAEPVALPWKNGHGVEVSQTRTDTGMGDQVYVSTKYASYGFAHVEPDVARDMARALWAAAGAAEKEQS
jgi:hypothetical protein